jgi:CheY-like chemotaxis protein
MGLGSQRPTPLGVARARFIDGLPRKAGELRGSIARLAGASGEERPREELRRRLHALYASAQVFQIAPLVHALKDAIARLDRARDENRPLSGEDLDALASVAETLPLLGQAEGGSTPPTEEPTGAVPPPAPVPAETAEPPTSTLDALPLSTPALAPTRTAEPEVASWPAEDAPQAAGAPAPRAKSASERPAPRHARGLDPVVSVLVVDAAEWQARARAMLPAERFEVLGAADPEDALRLARSSAPDVVMADWNVLCRPDVDLVRRLRDDPLTDFIPVVALVPPGIDVDPISARDRGADEALRKPFDRADLEGTITRLTGRLSARGALAGIAGEHTVAEVAERVADEIRRGLVEAADRGRDIAVPLGDGTEVLAAAWSAIGRIRAHLAQRSGGRVHFRDGPALGRPAFLALVDDETQEEGRATTPVSLRDRHVLVCDDDPAVVWFFAGLLREEGAIVEEAADGAEALARARRKRPDVVISDIVMPELDGFALTRELKRDPALADVPVILISWKEDFLHRMRELQSGASGYLRKEAGSAQILECVRGVLRPRARLEAQLRAGGDVRGRLEQIGILPLIKTVAQYRPDARITVRDAYNLFELDLRGGCLVDLTRTASDGSFSRGMRVLVPLLGATTGRFSVVDADAPVRASIRGPLDEVLRNGAAQLGALVDAVSGKGLALAAEVELDPDVVASLLRASPEPMRLLVEAMKSGKSPRALILGGEVVPHELESCLVDLARQGAILAVRGENGEDRIAAALRGRTDTEIPTRHPTEPPLPAPGGSGAPGRGGSFLEPGLLEGTATEPIGAGAEPSSAVVAVPAGAAQAQEASADASARARHEVPAVASRAAPRPAGAGEAEAVDEPASEETSHGPAPAAQIDEPASEAQIDEPAPEETSHGPAPAAKPAATHAPQEAPPLPPRHEPQTPRRSGVPEARPVAAAGQGAAAARSAAEGGYGLLGWAFFLVVLGVVGFVGMRVLDGSGGARLANAPRDPDLGETASEPAGGRAEGVGGGEGPEDRPDESPSASAAPTPIVRGYGRVEPGIAADYGVEVGEGEGLVVLEPAPDGTEFRVRLGDREHHVGARPVAVRLREGVHEVAFVRGEQVSFRFLRVQAGHTRYVPPP